MRRPHALSTSISHGAIAALSSPLGGASAAMRGFDMNHIAVRDSDTRTCQLPPSETRRASARITPNAPRYPVV